MDRKEKVKIISEFFGVTPKYLSVPSFAYEIETNDEIYTIDRQGEITNLEGRVMTLTEIVNTQQPELDTETEPAAEAIDGFELTLPMAGHTGTTLHNLVNILYSKQHLIMMAFETESYFVEDAFAEDLNKEDTATVGDFKTALEKLNANRCPGLSFDFEEKTLTLKLTGIEIEPDIIKAFTDLCVLVNDHALTLKRASLKQAQDDNPKYALRTWLIRIGMNGSQYKATRKTLLSNLEGSGAYRSVGEANHG